MPIIIIADDFSGAAELAGISLHYGLSAEILFAEVVPSSCDVLIICTDSRSKKTNEALEITKRVLEDIKNLHCRFVYKKIDSALRGYIIEEAQLQINILKKNKALIIPANPSLKRIIKNKQYLMNGIKINETAFANDPEFPVLDANVEVHLKNKAIVKKCPELLHDNEIIIGEAESTEDIDCWAKTVTPSMALIGAGDFYAALLNKDFIRLEQKATYSHLPHLYVSGTNFENSRNIIKNAFAKGAPVFYLTEELLVSTANETAFLNIISEKLRLHQKLILAFDDISASSSLTAEFLRQRMGDIVEKILLQNYISEIFIEGGSTAGVILKQLQIKRIVAVHELIRGVVQMQFGNFFLTVKPGSYELPQTIKDLYQL